MRRALVLASNSRPFLLAGLMLLVVCACANAQPSTRARRTQPTRPATTQTQTLTNADEDFDLNIDQKRITEHDFFASTSVAIGDEQAPILRVGVALGAQELDVLLRNVRGHVRFRATLDPILRVLDARRVSPPAPANPVP